MKKYIRTPIKVNAIQWEVICKKCGTILMYDNGNFSCASYYHNKDYCDKKEIETKDE